MLIRASSTRSFDLFLGFELTCCTSTMIHESICFSAATPKHDVFCLGQHDDPRGRERTSGMRVIAQRQIFLMQHCHHQHHSLDSGEIDKGL